MGGPSEFYLLSKLPSRSRVGGSAFRARVVCGSPDPDCFRFWSEISPPTTVITLPAGSVDLNANVYYNSGFFFTADNNFRRAHTHSPELLQHGRRLVID